MNLDVALRRLNSGLGIQRAFLSGVPFTAPLIDVGGGGGGGSNAPSFGAGDFSKEGGAPDGEIYLQKNAFVPAGGRKR